jgi:hypothetical protein
MVTNKSVKDPDEESETGASGTNAPTLEEMLESFDIKIHGGEILPDLFQDLNDDLELPDGRTDL